MEVNKLRFFTSRQLPQWDAVDTKQIVHSAIETAIVALNGKPDCVASSYYGDDFKIFGDESWLSHAVYNLVENALRVSSNQGSSPIKVQVDVIQQDNHVDIRVQDNGPGVVQGDERKIFKPFYTTEPGATGLGLANVRQVVEIHGGMILASNIPTGGAIFTLRFPRKGRSAAA